MELRFNFLTRRGYPAVSVTREGKYFPHLLTVRDLVRVAKCETLVRTEKLVWRFNYGGGDEVLNTPTWAKGSSRAALGHCRHLPGNTGLLHP